MKISKKQNSQKSEPHPMLNNTVGGNYIWRAIIIFLIIHNFSVYTTHADTYL